MDDAKNILIIDDERDFCEIFKLILEKKKEGVKVHLATEAHEGIRLYKEIRPTVTLLDIKMPGMNGIEVLSRIRQLDPKANVIMLTALGETSFEAEARAIGAVDFLRKELGPNIFVKVVDRILEDTAMGRGESMVFQGRIMVVDDDEDTRVFLRDFFQKKGYRVKAVGSGKEALDLLSKFYPHVVLLDIVMPEMDGFEVLHRIRQINQRVSVIMITGYKEKVREKNLDKIGVSDVITKPFNFDYLETSVLSRVISTTL